MSPWVSLSSWWFNFVVYPTLSRVCQGYSLLTHTLILISGPAVEFVASFEWYSLSPKSALCTKTEQETYNIPSASPFPPETNTEPAELSHHEIVAHHALLHILILAWSEPGGPLGGGFRLVAAISGEHDLGFKLINLTPVVTSHTYIYIYIHIYIEIIYIYIYIYIHIYIYI